MRQRTKHPSFNFPKLLAIGLHRVREWLHFYQRSFDAPYPTFIKRKTLVSHSAPEGKWIETGTYMGSTTKYLSKIFSEVITIEPSEYFYHLSKSRLDKSRNVRILFGTSEQEFENAILLETSKLNVWLDGHFSEGGTFQGSEVSPIIHELEVISRHQKRFEEIIVFVDDVRLFSKSAAAPTGYPPLAFLFEWAEKNGFDWQIQNDIFIAKMNHNRLKTQY
jgi:hypothetical protein